jgi:bacterioferritin (cytochrome b1)
MEDDRMPNDELLQLLNSDLKNEWMHLKFYLYHASAVCGLHAAECREFLVDAAKGEMEHVQQFQDRIWGLGGTPITEGETFATFASVEDILAEAHAIERAVVANYAKRVEQLAGLSSPEAAYLAVFYEDQLQDSYEDAERIQRMLVGTSGPAIKRVRKTGDRFLSHTKGFDRRAAAWWP